MGSSLRQMKTYPLLQGQIEVWHAWIANPTSVAYNLPAVVPFGKDIDLDRLEAALRTIWTQRKELHTLFRIEEDGEPRQWNDPTLPLPLTRMRMTEADTQNYIQCGFVRPFVVQEVVPNGHTETWLNGLSTPFVRFEIIETEVHNYLLYDIHHLLSDGITLSRAFLAKDLPAAYEDAALAKQTYGLYEHAIAENALTGSEQYKKDAEYFHQQMSEVTFTSLSAPVANPWGPHLEATAQIEATRVDHWCQEQGVSQNLLFMAAFSIVLSKLSREETVAFASLTHGRTDRRLTNAYGMFVCSLPVVAKVEKDLNTKDFTRQLRRWLIGCVRHHTYPLTHLCRDLHKTPSVTFAFQGHDILEQTTTGGKLTTGYQLVQGTTKNDLSCTIYLKDKHYEVRTEGSGARWSEERLERIANAVATCTESLMRHPDGTLADIEIVGSEKQTALIQLGQGEFLEYDKSQTFVSLFLQQAKATPDALAVTDGILTLTYNDLNRRSNQVAHYLRAKGIGRGDHVAITAGQCTQFVVAALATQRIGAAYVPIDSTWPKRRKEEVKQDAEVKIVINGDEQDEDLSRTNDTEAGFPLPTDLAYIIYTSGTTGRPKGVMISHRAKLNLIQSIVHLWHLTAESRISCHSSVAFDASVEDIFPVLTVGGSVHIMPEAIRRSLPQIHEFLITHRITGGCYTTHLGTALAEQFPLPMQYLCLGGERLAKVPATQPQIFNTYGPTEFTVDATYSKTSTLIGRPFPNLAAYVLDSWHHLVPQGETGELCLAGPQMADGYWKRPKETSSVFCEVPKLETKVYCTGDLVRWTPTGELEYMGRKDRQIKLHGYRIELEEIEHQLQLVQGVQTAAAAIQKVNGIDRLCAYYLKTDISSKVETFPKEGNVSPSFVREELSKTLPPYMMPDYLIPLDEMPLSTTGKIDYSSLPLPQKEIHYEKPINEEEWTWCRLFEQVTGAEQVSPTDNFFHLGGSSILATTLVAAAQQQGQALTYGDIFTYPTPRQLANRAHCSHETYKTHESHESYRSHEFHGTYKPHTPHLLLTGATGLLGSHILKTYLNTEPGLAYCLVRAHDEHHAFERVLEALRNHCGYEPGREQSIRIVPVVGDLFSLSPWSFPVDIEMVIHCAADTRHFAAGNDIEATNIDGTRNIIDFCQTKGTRLIHVSTLGIIPHTANAYIRSKSIAEQDVLQAIKTGSLQGCVMRIGNLMPSNGTYTTLQKALEALRELGVYPQALGKLPIVLSRTDDTARAILLLTRHADGRKVLSPYNPHTTTLAACLNRKGHVTAVSDEQFKKIITQALTTPINHDWLTPLLHYLDIIKSLSNTYCLPTNEDTTRILTEFHFYWNNVQT